MPIYNSGIQAGVDALPTVRKPAAILMPPSQREIRAWRHSSPLEERVLEERYASLIGQNAPAPMPPLLQDAPDTLLPAVAVRHDRRSDAGLPSLNEPRTVPAVYREDRTVSFD